MIRVQPIIDIKRILHGVIKIQLWGIIGHFKQSTYVPNTPTESFSTSAIKINYVFVRQPYFYHHNGKYLIINWWGKLKYKQLGIIVVYCLTVSTLNGFVSHYNKKKHLETNPTEKHSREQYGCLGTGSHRASSYTCTN